MDDKAIRYGMSFVSKGDAPATYLAAERELTQAANELLIEARKSGKSRYRHSHNGTRGYNKGHVYGGRMKVADKPYRTEVMRRNGAGGYRSPRPSVHGTGPSTRA